MCASVTLSVTARQDTAGRRIAHRPAGKLGVLCGAEQSPPSVVRQRLRSSPGVASESPRSRRRTGTRGDAHARANRRVSPRTALRRCKVARLAASLDPQSRTMAVAVAVDNADGQLAPGMYADARWPVRRSKRSSWGAATAGRLQGGRSVPAPGGGRRSIRLGSTYQGFSGSAASRAIKSSSIVQHIVRSGRWLARSVSKGFSSSCPI